MSTRKAEKLIPLTLIGPADELAPDVDRLPVETDEDLKLTELNLRQLAEELSTSLEHLERAVRVSRGTGFTGRLRELFDELDIIQRETSREFGRKVGDRLGREALWRVQKGVVVDE